MDPAQTYEPLKPEEIGKGRPRKLSAKTTATRQRYADAIRLRAAGYTLQEIADRLGFNSKSSVWEAIQRTLDRHEAAAVDDYREVTIVRLDMALKAIWPYALGIHQSQQPGRHPDLNALDRVLAIERERAKILGLYMPEQIDVRAIVLKMAEEEGFTADEKKDAVEFVEHHLQELRART